MVKSPVIRAGLTLLSVAALILATTSVAAARPGDDGALSTADGARDAH